MGATVLGVVRQGPRVLLLRQARLDPVSGVQLEFQLPGAVPEPGESPEEALVRTVYSLTGLTVAVVALLCRAEDAQEESVDYYACELLAEADEQSPPPAPPLWVHKRELSEYLGALPEALVAYLDLR